MFWVFIPFFSVVRLNLADDISFVPASQNTIFPASRARGRLALALPQGTLIPRRPTRSAIGIGREGGVLPLAANQFERKLELIVL